MAPIYRDKLRGLSRRLISPAGRQALAENAAVLSRSDPFGKNR